MRRGGSGGLPGASDEDAAHGLPDEWVNVLPPGSDVKPSDRHGHVDAMQTGVDAAQQPRVPADRTCAEGADGGVWRIRPNFDLNRRLPGRLVHAARSGEAPAP